MHGGEHVGQWRIEMSYGEEWVLIEDMNWTIRLWSSLLEKFMVLRNFKI